MKNTHRLSVLALLGGCSQEAVAVFVDDGVMSYSELELGASAPATPTGISFDPDAPDQLWLVGFTAGAVPSERQSFAAIGFAELENVDFDTPSEFKVEWYRPTDAPARLNRPMALSVASGRRMATCGDHRNDGYGQMPEDDYAGPTLWPLDRRSLADDAKTGAAVASLHESPSCMGIGWESSGTYWAFDGCGGRQNPTGAVRDEPLPDCEPLGDLVRYSFGAENPPGGTLVPAQGTAVRYSRVVTRVEGVPAGMVFDRVAKQLYVADPGGKRVLRIDPRLAYVDGDEPRGSADPGVAHRQGQGVTCTGNGDGCWVVTSAEDGVVPSGLVLWNRQLLVSDYENGRVVVYELPEDPPDCHLEIQDVADLDVGPLGHMTLGPEGTLWVVAPEERKLLRIESSVRFD